MRPEGSEQNGGRRLAARVRGGLALGALAGAVLIGGLPGRALAAPGELDLTFAGGRVTTDLGGIDSGAAIAAQRDGKLVVAGRTTAGGDEDFALVRYNVNGGVDPTFGSGGRVITGFGGELDSPHGVVIQPDGRIVAAGFTDAGGSRDFALARYFPNGSLDPSFGAAAGTPGRVVTDLGGDDEINEVLLQRDGKIVAAGPSDAGGTNDFATVRYQADGSLDLSFGAAAGTPGRVITDFGGGDVAAGAALQEDGRIVLAGSAAGDVALARYLADGTLDPTFGPDHNGKVLVDFLGQETSGRDVAIQGNGKIVVIGDTFLGIAEDFAVARLNPDGSLDNTFDGDGRLTTDFGGDTDNPDSVAIEPGGRIVVAGVSNASGSLDFAVARYLPNGALDPSFGSGGKVTTDFGGFEFPDAVFLQGAGRILVVGNTNAGPTLDIAIAAYRLK
jgi:uncharacterized delta-60 repeat protein